MSLTHQSEIDKTKGKFAVTLLGYVSQYDTKTLALPRGRPTFPIEHDYDQWLSSNSFKI